MQKTKARAIDAIVAKSIAKLLREAIPGYNITYRAPCGLYVTHRVLCFTTWDRVVNGSKIPVVEIMVDDTVLVVYDRVFADNRSFPIHTGVKQRSKVFELSDPTMADEMTKLVRHEIRRVRDKNLFGHDLPVYDECEPWQLR